MEFNGIELEFNGIELEFQWNLYRNKRNSFNVNSNSIEFAPN